MKKIFLIVIFVFFVYEAYSQDLKIETGKTFASFDYKNSKGEPLENLSHSSQNSLGVGMSLPLFNSSFGVSFCAIYSGYDVKGNDTILGNFYEWDIKFISTNLFFTYEFLKSNLFQYRKNGFSFFLKLGVSSDFLISGTQNVNNVFTDLKGVEDFNKPVFFVKGGIGVNYYFSKTTFIYIQYIGGKSFLIFGDYTNQEKLRFNSNNISVGIGINLYQSKVLN